MDKNFVIRCSRCGWKILTTGLTKDLEEAGLKEVTGCVNCSGRRFHCQKCGQNAKLFRIKGNT